MTSGRDSILGDPELHTAVVGDVAAMWQKLVWDIAQFNDIQRSNPDIPEPLGFAALNVCISAASLRGWTVPAVIQMRKAKKKKRVTEREVLERIYAGVPQQPMCEAIANTAKHSRLRPGVWPGGNVKLSYEKATEHAPSGYVLRHVHENGSYESLAVNAFNAMQRSWWGTLQNFDFGFSANPHDYEWQQRRLSAILNETS